MAFSAAPMRRQRPSSPTEVSHTRMDSNSYFFQPPRTPAASSPFSTRQSDGSSANATRKRTRPGLTPIQHNARTTSSAYNTLGSGNETPFGRSTSHWTHGSAGWTDLGSATSIARSDATSPQPFVNTTYALKGGMETPNQEIDCRADGSNLPDSQFRSRWNEAIGDISVNADLRTSAQRPYADASDATPNSGWGKMVFNLAGAVAGRMWNFCTSSPFRGFYAGPGKGSAVNPDSHESLSQAQSMWDTLDSMHTPAEEPFFARSMTPMPGGFPLTQPPHATKQQQRTPPRPSKRQHTDSGNGWVLVPPRGLGDCEPVHSTTTSPRPESPFRLSERKTPSQSFIPRPAPPSERQILSAKHHRPSLIPVSRRSSLVNTHNASPSLRPSSRQSSYANLKPTSKTNSVSTGVGLSTASHASPRCYTPTSLYAQPLTPSHSRNNSASANGNGRQSTSPLSPELQQYQARRQYEEEQADESIRSMNARLMGLIKMGEDALRSGYDGNGGMGRTYDGGGAMDLHMDMDAGGEWR